MLSSSSTRTCVTRPFGRISHKAIYANQGADPDAGVSAGAASVTTDVSVASTMGVITTALTYLDSHVLWENMILLIKTLNGDNPVLYEKYFSSFSGMTVLLGSYLRFDFDNTKITIRWYNNDVIMYLNYKDTSTRIIWQQNKLADLEAILESKIDLSDNGPIGIITTDFLFDGLPTINMSSVKVHLGMHGSHGSCPVYQDDEKNVVNDFLTTMVENFV